MVRLAVRAALALALLLDIGACMANAAVAALFGVAYVAALPFQGASWVLVFLSRRLVEGRRRAGVRP